MTPPDLTDDCSGTHSRPGHSTPKLWKAIGALDNAPLFNIPYLLDADMSDIVPTRGNKKPESCSITGTPLNNMVAKGEVKRRTEDGAWVETPRKIKTKHGVIRTIGRRLETNVPLMVMNKVPESTQTFEAEGNPKSATDERSPFSEFEPARSTINYRHYARRTLQEADNVSPHGVTHLTVPRTVGCVRYY